MFRDKNGSNKKDYFNSPDSPDHSHQDLDTEIGELDWGEVQWGLSEEEWVVCVWETSVSFIKTQSYSLSFIKICY